MEVCARAPHASNLASGAKGRSRGFAAPLAGAVLLFELRGFAARMRIRDLGSTPPGALVNEGDRLAAPRKWRPGILRSGLLDGLQPGEYLSVGVSPPLREFRSPGLGFRGRR